MTGLGVVVFAVMALFSIGLHEFGHFATARMFGIKVERFFIGFGPKLWSFRRGDTEYGIAALPLGGYVRISGMNPMEEIPPEDRARTFKAKAKWQRAIVLAAGSVTHFVLAFGILVAILALTTEPDFDSPTLRIDQVEAIYQDKPSPAAQAGLKPGDVLRAIDGQGVSSWDDVQKLLHERPGEAISIEVLRGEARLTLAATLASENPDGERVGFLGVAPEFRQVDRTLPQAVGEAGRRIGVGAKESLTAFGRIFSPGTLGRLFSVAAGRSERSVEDPATLVGVGRGAGDLARQGDFAGLFSLVAGFNIFVGVANLLPLPPLDGGHLAVLGYEKVRRREVDMRRLLPITAVVVSVFATLFVLLLYLDIARPLPPLPG